MTALMYTIDQSQQLTAIVNLLIDANADLNYKSVREGMTALMFANERESFEIVEILI